MGILLAAVELLIVVVIGLIFLIFNNVIRLRDSVDRAWSNIDVLLQKRHDLVTNLVNVVKGYASYEKTLLVKITQLRDSWAAVQDKDANSKMDESNTISSTVKTLFANVEKYPDLKADKTFMELQRALKEIENEIADSRQFYNDSVKNYNTNISVIPYSFLASTMNYKPLQYFQASDGEKEVVQTNM